MIYEQFLEEIKERVKGQLGETYDIQIYPVLKNNSIELDGLVILKEGDNISPNIYLNQYYEQYENGIKLEAISDEILHIYNMEMIQKKSNVDFEFNFDELKDCIYYRVINYSKNKKLLKEVPNIKFLDLAITFHCLVKDDLSGIGSIRITRDHMNKWEKNVKNLITLARINTPKLFPASIRSMNEVMLDIIKEDFKNNSLRKELSFEPNSEIANGLVDSDFDTEMFEKFVEEISQNDSAQMFILSNTKGINGASAMFYKDVIKNFAKELNSDLYILPSSIHEIILVPYQKNLTLDTLSEMVFDVNRTQVSPEEILSDKVYFYDRLRNKII